MSDVGSLFGMSGDEIYRNFREGAGVEGLSTSASTVNDLVVRYQQRAKRLAELRSRMEAVWQGDASDAANRGLGPAAGEHDKAGEALFTAEELTIGQAGSFDNAKNSVMRVPPEPTNVDPLNPFLSPEASKSFWEQTAEHQQAAQHNVDVMKTYSTSSTFNTDHQPDHFGDLVDDQSTISVRGSDSGGTIDSDDYQESTSDSGSSGAGPGPGSGGEPGVQQPSPGGTETQPGGPAGVGNAGTTLPGGYSPTPVPGGGTSLPPGGESGPGQPRGAVGGVGMPVGGLGTGAPRGAVVESPHGFGSGTGSGPGRAPAVVVSTTGPGRGGVGFGGVPVGGRGRDAEDTERKTPAYLEGEDPEELFDTDLLTAPPTIGEDDD